MLPVLEPVIVFGGGGQVGLEVSDLAQSLSASNSSLSIMTFNSQAGDITNEDLIRNIFTEQHPACVINCAAYTAVDKAESEAPQAFAVNRDGAANLARCCKTFNIPLLHVSTDYVFDGEQSTPYRESDATHPLNVYGESKLQGEQAIREILEQHIILRTSWVFGQYGNNFVKTMLRLAQDREELGIVADQTGCPTPACAIAQTLVAISQRVLAGEALAWGTYHYAGSPSLSWFDFATHIFQLAHEISGMKIPHLNPIPTSAYPTPAQRPQQTIMECDKIKRVFGIEPANWQAELRTVIESLYTQGRFG